MDYQHILCKVIEEEKFLIGPVAKRKAEEIEGIEVNEECKVKLEKDGEQALKEVLDTYSELVGEKAVASLKRNVCKELDEVPEEMKI